MNTAAKDIRDVAHQLIDELPKDSTWDDVLYHLAVRRSIEIGLKESEEGKGMDTESVRQRFGLNTK